MKEDKQAICNTLCEALILTRAGADVAGLIVDEEVLMNRLIFMLNKLALWALGLTSATIFILGACALDSDSALPFRWVVIGGLGLMATAIINEAEVRIWSRR